MANRRRYSEREVIDTLIEQGAVIPCKRCRIAFVKGDRIEREHGHELALGGSDEPENCFYSHEHCHAIVTYGTPATKAGSSRHRLEKTQPNHTEKFKPVKVPLDANMDRAIGKCSGCGEYEDGCTCIRKPQLSQLAGRARRARAGVAR